MSFRICVRLEGMNGIQLVSLADEMGVEIAGMYNKLNI